MENEALKKVIMSNITEILPHFTARRASELAEFLLSQGVKKELDLRRMDVGILKEKLDHVDACDLHDNWQQKYATKSTHAPSTAVAHRSVAGSSTQGAERRPLGNLQAAAQSTLRTPMPVYTTDSPYIPAEVRQAISRKIRPSSSARERMVDRIVDDCREKVPNLERSMFYQVAAQLVTMYPKTFKDSIPVSAIGCESLSKQMMDKFDNDKRPSVLSVKEKEAPSRKEAYGCILWNPALPEDETEESVEQYRQKLKDIHQLSCRDWDWKQIKNLSMKSYYLQRKDINGEVQEQPGRKRKNRSDDNPDDDLRAALQTKELRDRWPFLFTSKGANFHFKMLTGVDLREKLAVYIRESGVDLVEFLASKSDELAKLRRSMNRAEKAGRPETVLSAVLLMLTAFFKEDPSSFLRFIEPTTSFEDVPLDENFPDETTPVLMAAGTKIYDTDKFYVCVDGEVVSTEYSISDAFSLLFSSYFMLNIEYADSLACLLNFVQRAIAEINPLKGTKCSRPSLQKKANEKALKLNNKFVEFQQKLQQEDQEN